MTDDRLSCWTALRRWSSNFAPAQGSTNDQPGNSSSLVHCSQYTIIMKPLQICSQIRIKCAIDTSPTHTHTHTHAHTHTHTYSAKRKRLTPPRLSINSLDFKNPDHLKILTELGIVVQVVEGDKVQVSHNMAKANSPEDAEEGWYLMQDIVKLMNQQHVTGKMLLVLLVIVHVQLSTTCNVLQCAASLMYGGTYRN